VVSALIRALLAGAALSAVGGTVALRAQGLQGSTSSASVVSVVVRPSAQRFSSDQAQSYLIHAGISDAMRGNTRRPHFLALTGGAAAGFLIGAGTFALVPSRLESEGSDNIYLLTPAAAFFGGAIGTPLGAHLTNGRRGNYWLGLLATTAVQAAGVGLFSWQSFGDAPPAVKGAAYILLVQAPIAVAVERATERR
jgi:hypothetical protein